ncbi:MAG: hypothetical protein FJ271_32405 [Planctomycetes bacterium]|nr:hypothetical protein [Planctomycetota bacterium]
MTRKLLYAFVVIGIGLGVASGETLKGKILKIDGKSLTFQAKKAEAKTFELATSIKVYRMKKKEKEEVSEGLKAELFKTIDPEKGIPAQITTGDNNKVTEIVIGGKKKKKKNNN